MLLSIYLLPKPKGQRDSLDSVIDLLFLYLLTKVDAYEEINFFKNSGSSTKCLCITNLLSVAGIILTMG